MMTVAASNANVPVWALLASERTGASSHLHAGAGHQINAQGDWQDSHEIQPRNVLSKQEPSEQQAERWNEEVIRARRGGAHHRQEVEPEHKGKHGDEQRQVGKGEQQPPAQNHLAHRFEAEGERRRRGRQHDRAAEQEARGDELDKACERG
jgi:hypothetical protein